ncbi:MAG: hypothetical protein Q7S87_16190 [Agitococcus sp.]|nr:hypothetical protein [Agitococcus sp.]
MTDGTRYTVPATSESQAAGRLNIDWPGGRRSQLQGDGTTIAELAIIETVTFWHAQGLIEDKQSAVVELLAHFNCRTKRQDWEPRLTAKREREYQALIEKYTQTPTSQMLLELVRYVAMN